METFRYMEATQDSINSLKGRIQAIDEMECQAAIGVSADAALQFSFNISCRKWVGMIDDMPYCAFGVAPADSTTGSPWLLSATNASGAWAHTLRGSKEYIQKMLDPFAFLENYVHVKNIISIRWLKWCGFTLEAPRAYGVRGELFHRFWLMRGGEYV